MSAKLVCIMIIADFFFFFFFLKYIENRSESLHAFAFISYQQVCFILISDLLLYVLSQCYCVPQ